MKLIKVWFSIEITDGTNHAILTEEEVVKILDFLTTPYTEKSILITRHTGAPIFVAEGTGGILLMNIGGVVLTFSHWSLVIYELECLEDSLRECSGSPTSFEEKP